MHSIFKKEDQKETFQKREKIISPNGFGISEVAEGISERSGERPKGHFAYSVLGEVASEASGEPDRNYFRSR